MTRKRAFVRAMSAAAGIAFLLTGLALLLVPEWFYVNVGPFPPYNRHYTGDLGAFQIPLGIALLVSLRRPFTTRLLIATVAAGSVLHALNHAYDAWTGGTGTAAWLSDVLPLALFALLLCVAALFADDGTSAES